MKWVKICIISFFILGVGLGWLMIKAENGGLFSMREGKIVDIRKDSIIVECNGYTQSFNKADMSYIPQNLEVNEKVGLGGSGIILSGICINFEYKYFDRYPKKLEKRDFIKSDFQEFLEKEIVIRYTDSNGSLIEEKIKLLDVSDSDLKFDDKIIRLENITAVFW